MRYFIYCRKSSEAEDRQVASIESQLTTLQRTFGERPDIQIAGIYEEACSAKSPGRLKFGEMLSLIEKGEADGIIAWAPDRLARNSVDGGQIVYMLDRGVIRDLKFSTYTFENNSQGKFMLQIMFGQSKYYSDALSDNVKRGNQSKIEKGWRPNKPPFGYKNDPATRTIVRDPDRFPFVRQIFEHMLGGTSPSRIWEIARYEWDLRTPRRRKVGGRPIPLSYVYKILGDPFYAGVLMWNGRSYAGAHEPVVSLDQFERVRALLRKAEKSRPVFRSFAFTGMIRCGACSLMVTAEEKTNRHGSHYTYYHCTRRREQSRCRQPSVARSHLEEQIDRFICRVTLSADFHDWAVKHLSHSQEAERKNAEERQRTLQTSKARAKDGINNLIALRIRNLITDDEFVRERNKLESEQLRIGQQITQDRQTTEPFEPFEALISFSARAANWFREGDDETKRLIFGIVGSNPVLKDKILNVEAKKPFVLQPNEPDFPQLRAVRDEIRTLWINQDPELVGIIAGIRKLELKLGIPPSGEHHRRSRRRAA